MKFIELTDWRNSLIIVNASSIKCIMAEADRGTIITFIGDTYPLRVLETPEKIIDKIEGFTEALI